MTAPACPDGPESVQTLGRGQLLSQFRWQTARLLDVALRQSYVVARKDTDA